MMIGVSNLGILDKPFKFIEKLIEKLDKISVLEIVDDLPHKLNDKRIAYLKELSSTHNLKLVVHAPFNNINACAVNPSIRRASIKELLKCFDRAKKLESELVVVHLGLDSPISLFKPGFSWSICLNSARELLELASQRGVQIAFENLTKNTGMLKNVEEVRKLIENIDDVKLSFDIGHANLVGQIRDFLENFIDFMIHAHLHDNDGIQDLHLPVGEGTIDWNYALPKLRKIKGPLVIEPLNFQGALKSFKNLSSMLDNLVNR
ncbi:MAG: hypothetical protein DRJ31_04285 [Candidatus Methanomethylicota archaeon]|uniref:Xylose isomerase-like TIM barrel domain-containing protein n=1 Tax=Thermoproteota archaeon TaxID=2056631 RepID=A0A497EQU3_9CREN|nr:MAG: hypothetical protein DRJ31_04285 [Candidatus Verstraetearchaeota archaeon]